MFPNQSVPLIVTALDESDDKTHSHVYHSFVKSGLRKLLPRPSLLEDMNYSHSETYESLFRSLPIIKKMDWKGSFFHSAVLLLCRSQIGSEKFFYEMIGRWLLPGKRIKIESFISCNFFCPEFDSASFTLCELVFSLENEYEIELVRRHFPILEAEIKIGVLSFYQANRILEIKGLSSNEKTALIQERISSLIQRHPDNFDYDIFGQMQHFLVTSHEEFKQVREYQHMSRIVYVFYLFRKALKSLIEKTPEKRHVSFKLSRVRLHLPLGMKKVLGVFVGMNFLKNHEIFEERHLIKAIRGHLPQIKPVDGSWFISASKDDKVQVIYLEIEKEDGTDFTLNEIYKLRKKLPHDLKNNVEKLMPSLFMPRNEEEVMKYIITLSQELKYVRDIPQVIISFEEQTDAELSFTVILLRLLSKAHEPSVQDLHKQIPSRFKLIEDRVKKVGMLRKKYPKEATVFRLKLPKVLFMREDHSVDLLKARQEVVKEVHRMVGEFRDYNGGMISKQNETLTSFKKLVADHSQKNDLHLENFFHSIFPVEIRSVIDPVLLQHLFYMYQDSSEKKLPRETCFEYKVEEISEVLLVMIIISEPVFKQKVQEAEKKMHLASSQIVSFLMNQSETIYMGYILFSLPDEKKALFLNNLQQIQEASLSSR
jgi:hypothetical protein